LSLASIRYHYGLYYSIAFFFFFFQAEDGIRDSSVTGVQTCALPISIWRDVRKLPPASFVAFVADAGPGTSPTAQSYWSLRDTVVAAQGDRISGESEAIARLEQLLSTAVKRQRSEEHTSELQSHLNLVCRLLLEKKKI